MRRYFLVFIIFLGLVFKAEASNVIYFVQPDKSTDSIYIASNTDSLILDLSGYSADSVLIIPTNKVIQINYISKSRYLLKPGQESGNFTLNIAIFSDQYQKTATKLTARTVIVRSSTWWFWTLFGIIGGLGLFLFGINYMSDGFIRLMGNRLHKIIQRFSRNAVTSINSGVILTTIMQSSSAVSIFLTKLVDNELMTFRQTLGVVVGAALGTTVTLQIIALQINAYALLLISVGFVLSFLIKKTTVKRIGQIFTGLGLLYLGLLLMSQAASVIKTVPEISGFLTNLSNPFTGVLIGILFTAITQSASAFIGLLIMLGSLNLISLEASVSLFIGSNIGTSIPVLLAIGDVENEAKWVAYFHLIYRIIGASLFIFWIGPFTDLVVRVSDLFSSHISLPHLIANAHTIMYVILTIILTPFLTFAYNHMKKFVKADESGSSLLKPKYINDQALETPSIAIILAKKEIMHMANITKKMVEQIAPLFLNKDKKILTELEKHEKAVNSLRDSITDYLLKLNKGNLSEESLKESYKLLAIVKELEEIGDIIDTNLLPKARYWIENNLEFSEQGKTELMEFHHRCYKLVTMVTDVMVNFDEHKVRKIKKKEKENIQLVFDFEKSHFTRLIEHVDKSLQSSKTHIELLGLMQAITRHATQIVRILYDVV